jgi:hypothetical protein
MLDFATKLLIQRQRQNIKRLEEKLNKYKAMVDSDSALDHIKSAIYLINRKIKKWIK